MDETTAKPAPAGALFADWFDPIETAVRSKVRGFIEALIEEETEHGASSPALRPSRRVTGGGWRGWAGGWASSWPSETIADRDVWADRDLRSACPTGWPRWQDDGVEEPIVAGLSAPHPGRGGVDRLGLFGRHQYAAGPARAGGGVREGGRQGHVSRTWRKVKGDWDGWNARSLAEEPILRLILDGTVVRVRLDKKATSVSLLVALGVRADGQKVLLAVKNMGGESEAAWRALLDDLVKRGLKTPELVIVDGGSGLDAALAALWSEVPVPALHGAQASQPPGACARAPARGTFQRLPRHDLRRDRQGWGNPAARLSCENGG